MCVRVEVRKVNNFERYQWMIKPVGLCGTAILKLKHNPITCNEQK